MKSYEFTLPKKCAACGDPLELGFARCRNPDCGKLRAEFETHAGVVAGKTGACMWRAYEGQTPIKANYMISHM